MKFNSILAVTLALVLVTSFGTPVFAEDKKQENKSHLLSIKTTIFHPAVAPDHIEVDDAGESLLSAQAIDGSLSLDSVTGTIEPEADVDLYRICVTVSGDLTFDALAIPNDDNLDMNLHIFNSKGNPLGADDDSSPFQDLGSRVTINVVPGTYYFAVGSNNLEALDSENNKIQDNDFGIINPNGVLGGWSTDAEEKGPYQILLSGAKDITDCQPVGGDLISIDSTALLLSGVQSFSWMIPVALSVFGIGLFIISRISENS